MKKQKQAQQEMGARQKGNLNMGIARAHEVAAQLVGIQLAASNLIAITVSASSIVAGTITYAVLNQPGAWPFWLAAGVIGALLALLIEGMTLGALIRIRLANKQIHLIVAKLEAERDEAAKLTGGKHQGQYKWWSFRKRRQYATRTYRKSRRYSIPLAFVGATASATAGGLFYHQILGSLGTIQSIGVSALFALIVTGTFVSSELFRDVQEEAVRESFKGGSLSEEALREETYRQTNQAVAAEVATYLSSLDAKEAIKKAAGQLLGDVLAELRKKSAERVGHTDVTPFTQGQLLLAAPTGQMVTGHSQSGQAEGGQVDTGHPQDGQVSSEQARGGHLDGGHPQSGQWTPGQSQSGHVSTSTSSAPAPSTSTTPSRPVSTLNSQEPNTEPVQRVQSGQVNGGQSGQGTSGHFQSGQVDTGHLQGGQSQSGHLDAEQVNGGQQNGHLQGGHLDTLNTGHLQGGQFQSGHLDTQKTSSPKLAAVDGTPSSSEIEARVFNLLEDEPGLSARTLAGMVHCSPTTASRLKKKFEASQAAAKLTEPSR